MESITKNHQPARTLRAMVERAYGAAEVPGDGEDWIAELGHGWFNVAYRLRLRSGRQVALKIAPPAGVEVLTYERDAMATELAALDLVRRLTGVPVPAVDHADRTHELCDADYFFMPYVDADNLDLVREALAPAELAGYQEAIGAITRELNGIRGTAFGPLTGPGEATWRSAFLRMVGDVLADGERRGVDLGHGYDVLREAVAARADHLDEVTEPRFVEWDLWPGNCLVRDGRIVAVLDHERAFYGDPLMEFGFVACELASLGDPAPFLRGYGHPPLTDGERVRRRLYNLYLALVQVIEVTYRAQTGTGQAGWARARLDEAVAALDAPLGGTGPQPARASHPREATPASAQ